MKNTTVLFKRSLAGCGVAAIAVGLLTSALNGADEESNPADSKAKAEGAPNMAEMMKKMEEVATPAPEHQWLASLAGEWEAEARCYKAGTDTDPMITKGTCSDRMILGGRFLQEEFQGDMMGKSFHGIGLTGYDKFNKKFVSTWIDDMGTGILVSEGSRDASGNVLTMEGKMDDPMTGEKAKPMRLVTRIIGPDKHIFEMHDLGLGEKSKVMEITYVRKGGASGTALTAK